MKKTAIYLLSFLTAAFMLLAVGFTAFGGVKAVRADYEEEEQKIIDVTMGENFSPAQFGSATAVNIAEGEKLVYSFDLAYAVVAASNIFVGAVVSAYPVGTNSYPMVTLDHTNIRQLGVRRPLRRALLRRQNGQNFKRSKV